MKRKIILSSLIGLGLSASAAEIAHWGLDEGTATSFGESGSDFYMDQSGNGNDLATWADFTTPEGSSDRPFTTVPQTGAPNPGSLHFVGNDDLYTGGKMINAVSFDSSWTVEASFKADSSHWGVIVGKDGDTGGPPPFSLKFRDDNLLEVGFWNDDTSSVQFFATSSALNLAEWYSVAVTFDGADAKIYLKGASDADYLLAAQTAAAGGNLHPFDSTWTVGRGQWNGGNTDWFQGYIDEVKISDVALDPTQFVAVPEPATLGMLALVGGGMLWVRKRFMI